MWRLGWSSGTLLLCSIRGGGGILDSGKLAFLGRANFAKLDEPHLTRDELVSLEIGICALL